jgi:prepilin-type N-terminal cleavage/methylation domain-containing protein
VQRGFSLVEVIVVLALLSIICGSTLFFTSSTYQRTAFLSERDSLLSVLQTARGRALNNSNQTNHGVALYPSSYMGYVLFEGDTYVNSNPSFHTFVPALYPVTIDPSSPKEIVFEQLSGSASYSGYVILTDGNRMATTAISINFEGAISR